MNYNPDSVLIVWGLGISYSSSTGTDSNELAKKVIDDSIKKIDEELKSIEEESKNVKK
ncbi:hypothetical protein [Borreliella burgdorferi]|uniref:hypothetical protein n=1 Tax=Borreliella burgdorferi TaxID=139 RepID=UPI00017F38F4